MTSRKRKLSVTKTEETPNEKPTLLLGNMKNKLNTLFKLNTSSSLNDTESVVETNTIKQSENIIIKSEQIEMNDSKSTLNINSLKRKLNTEIKAINFQTDINAKLETKLVGDFPDRESIHYTTVEVKSEQGPVNIKLLKYKLSTEIQPLLQPTKHSNETPLNLLSLKNKLGTALKLGEKKNVEKIDCTRTSMQKKSKGYLLSYNQFVADKKNRIYYCKVCFKYFQHLSFLQNHILRHAAGSTFGNVQNIEKKMIKIYSNDEYTQEKSNNKEITTKIQNQNKSQLNFSNLKNKLSFAMNSGSEDTVTETRESTTIPETSSKEKPKEQCKLCKLWFINLKIHIGRSHSKTE